MNAHLARARRMFGPDAHVERTRAGRVSAGQGRLSGACGVCLKHDCRRPWSVTIGVLVGSFFSVKGHGHTWAEAWNRAMRRGSRTR